MEYIRQYHSLCFIQPEYYHLEIPFYKSSQKRFQLNLEEIKLFYNKEFGVYLEDDKKGGDEGDERDKNKKILCIISFD